MKRPTRVQGDYRGGSLVIWHFSRRSGKSSHPYIGLRLGLENPRNLSFNIYREGFFSKIDKTFGMEDVQVGDAEFDQRFIVKCSDPVFIRMALLPETREKFIKVFEAHKASGSFTLKENEIYYEQSGRIRSDECRTRFVAISDLCADLREMVSVYQEL